MESIGKLGLSTISTEQIKVSVRVEGVVYDIGNLTASDIRVYPDISKGYHSRNAHSRAQRERSATAAKDVTIQEITPSSVQIKFDSLQTKTLDIKAKLSGYSAPDDYLIRDVSVSPSTVQITGPAEGIFPESANVLWKRISMKN